MALAIYYLRKVASNVKGSPGTNPERVVQMPEGGIPTAVATKMVDLETAEGHSVEAPPPYAPHANKLYLCMPFLLFVTNALMYGKHK
jgi:hypothetical protein